MEPSNRDEQTPEEKLVDELVGIRMQIEGKVRDDAPSDKQREIKSIVKKAWVNGATCEEIERTYNENVMKYSYLEKDDEDIKFSNKQTDFGTKSKKQFQKVNVTTKKSFQKIKVKVNDLNIKNNALRWWKDRTKDNGILKTNNESYNNILKKKDTGSFNKPFNSKNSGSLDELTNTFRKSENRKNPSSLDELKNTFRKSENNKNSASSNKPFNSKNYGSLDELTDKFRKSENYKNSRSFNKSLNNKNSGSLDELSIKSRKSENNKNPRSFDKSLNSKNSGSLDELSNKSRKSENNKNSGSFNKPLNNENNSFFNEPLTSKFRKSDKNINKTQDSQSYIDIDKEKYKQESMKENMVEELVGLGSSFGKELNSLAIPDIYKFAIKTTVKSVWKEGGSAEKIQKTYQDLATKHLQDKEELEKQKSLKIELEELKKEEIIKKEIENNKLKFEGYFQEIQKDFPNNNEKEFYCNTLLEDNTIFIEKKKPISKSFCGENKILYLDILSAVYEKENPQYDYVQIFTNGFIFKLINKNRDNSLKDFYDKLMEKINKEKTFYQKDNQKDEKSSCSNADELMKWHELKERGVITPEEFENKKKKLL